MGRCVLCCKVICVFTKTGDAPSKCHPYLTFVGHLCSVRFAFLSKSTAQNLMLLIKGNF